MEREEIERWQAVKKGYASAEDAICRHPEFVEAREKERIPTGMDQATALQWEQVLEDKRPFHALRYQSVTDYWVGKLNEPALSDVYAAARIGRNMILLAHRPWAEFWASKAAESRRDLSDGARRDLAEDLTGPAVGGLSEAMVGFDPVRGFKFATFARGFILHAIYSSSEMLRDLPKDRGAQLKKLREAEDRLFRHLEREPTDDEAAGESGVTLDQVKECLREFWPMLKKDHAAAEDAICRWPDFVQAREAQRTPVDMDQVTVGQWEQMLEDGRPFRALRYPSVTDYWVGKLSEPALSDVYAAARIGRNMILLAHRPRAEFWARKAAESRRDLSDGARRDLAEDLTNAAICGLSEAMVGFDPDRGFKFDTFARGFIIHAIYSSPEMLRDLPKDRVAQLKKLREAEDKLFGHLERQPTDDEAAGESGLTLDQVKECRLDLRFQFPESLDQIIEAGNSEDASENTHFPEPSSLPTQRDTTDLEIVLEALTKLPDRNRRVVQWTYLGNLPEFPPLADQEIAARLGISEGNVRKIRCETLRKLQDALSSSFHGRIQALNSEARTFVIAGRPVDVKGEHITSKTFVISATTTVHLNGQPLLKVGQLVQVYFLRGEGKRLTAYCVKVERPQES